jgi:hypothetical protein
LAFLQSPNQVDSAYDFHSNYLAAVLFLCLGVGADPQQQRASDQLAIGNG